MDSFIIIGGIVIGSLIGIVTIINIVGWLLSLRRVVPTDQVHIVQSGKETISYGSGLPHGTVYYAFPPWIPKVGVTVKGFKVSNFEIRLNGYRTYDSGRLPLSMDLSGFFRIQDTNMAAKRVSSQEELNLQLKSILESVARAIISKFDVEKLLEARSELGVEFTKEISKSLVEWGVVATKNVEIADIDDADGSKVIQNLTAKKQSEIDKDSRIEVSKNRQLAEEAEINVEREVQLKRTDAEKEIGTRKVEAQREVDLKNQNARQLVEEQARITKEKEMAVAQVANVEAARINQQVKVIQAEEAKQVAMTKADADKYQVEIAASAKLNESTAYATAHRLEEEGKAAGIAAVGKAQAEALTAKELAPVTAQTTLAKEIGLNKEYQSYLITIEKVKAVAAVGVEQAKALANADIKVIANSQDATTGLSSAGEMISSKGGMNLGAMFEGFAATDIGKQVLNTVGISTEDKEKQ